MGSFHVQDLKILRDSCQARFLS